MHRPLINEHRHKILSNIIVTAGAFLGFEAISYSFGIYQLKDSLYLSMYIYAFHIFWLNFLFDLHLKNKDTIASGFWSALKQRFGYMYNWHHFRHYQNYLVLPGLIYWATVVLLFLNPFKGQLKQTLIIASTLALSVTYWYMKEHISLRLEARDHWIRLLSIVKLFAAFLIYSAVIVTTNYFDFGADFLVLSTLTLTFLLVYQALFQHGFLRLRSVMWIVIISLTQSVVALWVYNNWNSEYFTAGIVMAATYNTFWGILHHHIEKTLSKKVVFEYLLMMVLVISFLFASHDFNQRIG